MTEPKPPIGTVVRRQMMTNSIRVMIDFEPAEDLRLAQMFPQGQSVVIAPLTPEAAKGAKVEEFVEKSDEKGPYGAIAQALHRSNWFHSSEVQGAIGCCSVGGARSSIISHFGVWSLTQISPAQLSGWAKAHDVFHTLPKEVKDAI